MANVKLGTKAVGSIVKLKVGGAAKEFIVVHQGKPSSIYDESCNGTWLLMRDCYESRQWHSSNVNKLESSTIHSYLNGPFLNLFESNIRNAIKQVKIPYLKGGGASGWIESGNSGLHCKIFLLSGYEVGFTTSDTDKFPVDGAKLDYFESGNNSSAQRKRVAYLNDLASSWWLRSPHTGVTTNVWYVTVNGGYSNYSASRSSDIDIRPALVLPQDMEVDSSGNVTPPPIGTHKTLINGTAYDVQGGKCRVNGTGYEIKKGRTLIGGTGYDITLPSAGTKLSTLDVGQSVFANVNGKKTEFLVVHQGLPSSMYDNNCDGTWLLMKDCYEKGSWNSFSNNNYENSTINTYLNGAFLTLFDPNIQSLIKQVKIPYRKGLGSSGTDQSGANGLPAKIFLLSGYEVGLAGAKYIPNDGAKLDYFNANTGGIELTRIAKYNGADVAWWLRSPYTKSTNGALAINRNGGLTSVNPTSDPGVRPCIILPSDAFVNDEFELIA